MDLPSYFIDFLSEIRLTECQRQDAAKGHMTLRQRLNSDPHYRSVIVSDFLQGSYRRSTAVRPKGDKRSDVDIIVVTNLDHLAWSPSQALNYFEGFAEKYYSGKYTRQGRSIGITLSYVELDLVVTAAPSEAQKNILKSESVRTLSSLEQFPQSRLDKAWSERTSLFEAVAKKEEPIWKMEPLLIPDRDAGEWDKTHPLAQLAWTADKNKRCNDHFVNVVKVIKWWRINQHDLPKYPKSYPVERIIGECCPDGIKSVAEGITQSLEAIVTRFRIDVMQERTPILSDYGVPEHNVLHRVSPEDFKAFYEAVDHAARLARTALDEQDLVKSACAWRALLGEKFPEPPGGCVSNKSDDSRGSSIGGFTPRRSGPSTPSGGRFA